MKMSGRVQALESRSGSTKSGQVHWIVQSVDRTYDNALAAYGAGNIGPQDEVVVWRVTGPRADSTGQVFKATVDRQPRGAR